MSTESTSPRRLRLSLLTAGVVASLLFFATACGGSDEGAEDPGEGEETSAPLLDEEEPERLQLMEGTPVSLANGEVSVLLTGVEDGDTPEVEIEVRSGDGDPETETLSQGEALELNGENWLVSEIGVSEDEGVPSSATIVREGSGEVEED